MRYAGLGMSASKSHPRHRKFGAVRGSRAHTRAVASACVANLSEVLWVGRTAPGDLRPAQVRRALGRSADAVVLDLHDGPDADLIGQCHGFVRGGGMFILRMPPGAPTAGRERLTVHPHSPDEVGMRFWSRIERMVAAWPQDLPVLDALPEMPQGSVQQQQVVTQLQTAFTGSVARRMVLVADRGRGKSSALGLAAASAVRAGQRVGITADSARSAAEVVRFSGGVWQPPQALLHSDLDVLIIDEAARISVPLLQALVRRHAHIPIAFASTVRGYEGTGRGFVLRFLAWLQQQPAPVTHCTLHQPIRWAEGDPLEADIFRLLAVDAEPALNPPAQGALVSRMVDRDALAADEDRLRQIFGLLVHAHYRTTPGDLHRLLDAPNLSVHVLERGGMVVAVTMVAVEGGLPEDCCARIAAGTDRMRGHALPDTLMTHAGQRNAGMLRVIRSVRIATHPALRRTGLASRLVAHVHAHHQPDLFGTMFGATPAVLRFRRSVGYTLVRVGVSAGTRTGEPSAVMLRPCTPPAVALIERLRQLLARDLPLQLSFSDGLFVQPGLRQALVEGLGEGHPWSMPQVCDAVRRYAHGPCPSDAIPAAMWQFVGAHEAMLDAVEGGDVLRARIVERRSWQEIAAGCGERVPVIQRRMRRATQALLALERPSDRQGLTVPQGM